MPSLVSAWLYFAFAFIALLYYAFAFLSWPCLNGTLTRNALALLRIDLPRFAFAMSRITLHNLTFALPNITLSRLATALLDIALPLQCSTNTTLLYRCKLRIALPIYAAPLRRPASPRLAIAPPCSAIPLLHVSTPRLRVALLHFAVAVRCCPHSPTLNFASAPHVSVIQCPC